MIGWEFAGIIEDCLLRLDRGEDLPEVLADFPDQEERIKPLLLVAMASRAFQVPIPCQTAQRLGRNQMLAEMNKLAVKKAFRSKPTIPLKSHWIGKVAGSLRRVGFNKMAYSYRLAMVSLVLVLTGGFLTINASASSQPGDFLYTLKQSIERSGLVWVIQSEDPSDESGTVALPGRNADGLPGSERSVSVLMGVNQMLTEEDKGSRPPAFANSNPDTLNIEDEGNPVESSLDDVSGDTKADLPENSAAIYAPGQQEGSATDYAPGLQDEPATDYAPGQVKKLSLEDEQEVDDKDKEEKEAEKDLKEEEKDEAKDLKQEDKELKTVETEPSKPVTQHEKEVEKIKKITEKDKAPKK